MQANGDIRMAVFAAVVTGATLAASEHVTKLILEHNNTPRSAEARRAPPQPSDLPPHFGGLIIMVIGIPNSPGAEPLRDRSPATDGKPTGDANPKPKKYAKKKKNEISTTERKRTKKVRSCRVHHQKMSKVLARSHTRFVPVAQVNLQAETRVRRDALKLQPKARPLSTARDQQFGKPKAAIVAKNNTRKN